jgi:hypothetical protein
VLKQTYGLALKDGRISRIPGRFPMLKEESARQGFFEHNVFEAVKANLPTVYADAAEFAYLSAWRKGDTLPLRWDAVDRTANEIRLKTSKNGRGRVIPLEGAARAGRAPGWRASKRGKCRRPISQIMPTSAACADYPRLTILAIE